MRIWPFSDCGVLFFCFQNDEFMRIAINSIRNDLISRNEAFQCLALSFVGNGKGIDEYVPMSSGPLLQICRSRLW